MTTSYVSSTGVVVVPLRLQVGGIIVITTVPCLCVLQVGVVVVAVLQAGGVVIAVVAVLPLCAVGGHNRRHRHHSASA